MAFSPDGLRLSLFLLVRRQVEVTKLLSEEVKAQFKRATRFFPSEKERMKWENVHRGKERAKRSARKNGVKIKGHELK